MENTIIEMVQLADDEKNLDLISKIKDILENFYFFDCPDEWKNLGEKLEGMFSEDSWIYKQLDLSFYVTIPFC